MVRECILFYFRISNAGSTTFFTYNYNVAAQITILRPAAVLSCMLADGAAYAEEITNGGQTLIITLFDAFWDADIRSGGQCANHSPL